MIIDYNIELLGIREKEGEHIRIMLAFAHTLQYVGLNRFIANCEDVKFSLIEIIYCGQVGNGDDGFENLYDIPNYILYDYDYVSPLGDGYYEFVKDGENTVLYNANDGSIKDTFYPPPESAHLQVGSGAKISTDSLSHILPLYSQNLFMNPVLSSS